MESLTIDQLALQEKATIIQLDEERLQPDELLRLRNMGLHPDVQVEKLHQGVFGGRDPLAIRVGDMRMALRLAYARAIMVRPLDESEGES